MNMTPQEYRDYIKQRSPKSPIVKDTALAFVIGGAICVLGQLILNGFRSLGNRSCPLCRSARCRPGCAP